MAKATLKPIEPVKPNVLLELTHEEALVLRKVTGMIGGVPGTTRRKHTDAIQRALAAVGFEVDYNYTGVRGNITFYN